VACAPPCSWEMGMCEFWAIPDVTSAIFYHGLTPLSLWNESIVAASNLRPLCAVLAERHLCARNPACLWEGSSSGGRCDIRRAAFYQAALEEAVATPIGWALMFWGVRDDVCRTAAHAQDCGSNVPSQSPQQVLSSQYMEFGPLHSTPMQAAGGRAEADDGPSAQAYDGRRSGGPESAAAEGVPENAPMDNQVTDCAVTTYGCCPDGQSAAGYRGDPCEASGAGSIPLWQVLTGGCVLSGLVVLGLVGKKRHAIASSSSSFSSTSFAAAAATTSGCDPIGFELEPAESWGGARDDAAVEERSKRLRGSDYPAAAESGSGANLRGSQDLDPPEPQMPPGPDDDVSLLGSGDFPPISSFTLPRGVLSQDGAAFDSAPPIAALDVELTMHNPLDEDVGHVMTRQISQEGTSDAASVGSSVDSQSGSTVGKDNGYSSPDEPWSGSTTGVHNLDSRNAAWSSEYLGTGAPPQCKRDDDTHVGHAFSLPAPSDMGGYMPHLLNQAPPPRQGHDAAANEVVGVPMQAIPVGVSTGSTDVWAVSSGTMRHEGMHQPQPQVDSSWWGGGGGGGGVSAPLMTGLGHVQLDASRAHATGYNPSMQGVESVPLPLGMQRPQPSHLPRSCAYPVNDGVLLPEGIRTAATGPALQPQAAQGGAHNHAAAKLTKRRSDPRLKQDLTGIMFLLSQSPKVPWLKVVDMQTVLKLRLMRGPATTAAGQPRFFVAVCYGRDSDTVKMRLAYAIGEILSAISGSGRGGACGGGAERSLKWDTLQRDILWKYRKRCGSDSIYSFEEEVSDTHVDSSYATISEHADEVLRRLGQRGRPFEQVLSDILSYPLMRQVTPREASADVGSGGGGDGMVAAVVPAHPPPSMLGGHGGVPAPPLQHPPQQQEAGAAVCLSYGLPASTSLYGGTTTDTPVPPARQGQAAGLSGAGVLYEPRSSAAAAAAHSWRDGGSGAASGETPPPPTMGDGGAGGLEAAGAERRYLCTWGGCEYSSQSSGHLARHLRIHTGEKPYRCDWPGCNYGAAQRGHLTAHRRKHTGERPFRCTQPGCSFSASRSWHLTRHHKAKHEGVPLPLSLPPTPPPAAAAGTAAASGNTHSDHYSSDYSDHDSPSPPPSPNPDPGRGNQIPDGSGGGGAAWGGAL
jgi:hypothetical protein